MLDDEPIDRPQEQGSLQQRAVQGSLWTLIGYGSSQVLRLFGNLALTRLLTPDAFGLMALVQTFLTGLHMFSDFGILPSIVQSRRGGELAFLNTAWTIQVIRGSVLWLGACLIAIPVAHLYKEPLLMQILPIGGLGIIIDGFSSTKLATANRQLALKRLTLIDLITYSMTLIVMVAGAWVYRSVWALVWGGVIGGLLKMIASHRLLKGEQNVFCWDQDAVKEIRQFGRWIFLSTIVGFFALQGDRLVLGWLLDVRFLGIYSIALGLSGIVEQIVSQVNSRVLFPSYAELIRERPASLYRVLRKARLILIATSAACVIFLVLFGKPLIALMYDDRYLEAGWILRVLAVGFLGRVLSITYGDVLLARGDTFATMSLTFVGTGIQFAAMFIGYDLGGVLGVIVGLSIAEWLTYLTYAACFARLSLWQPELDLPAAMLAIGMAALVYYT